MLRRFAFVRHLAVLLICLGVVLGVGASASRADSLTQLPSGLHEPWMAVDPGNQHVFVSSGAGGSTIVVLDFSGNVIATIPGEAGAAQMAVDTATHTLYVALYNANAISEIDTQTLTEKARFSTASIGSPYSLVIAGGKLWFSCLGGSGCIASANLDGTGLTSAISTRLPVLLSAGGSNNHILATAAYGVTPAGVSLYDVSSGSATPVNGPLGDPGGQPCALGDFAVTPAADYVVFASPCQSHVAALATDVQAGASFDYPSGYGPNAVAVSPDGQYVAMGNNGGSVNSSIVQVFPTGSAEQAWGWALNATPHDLAFSPDGLHLFALVGVNGGFGFQVLDRYTAPDTQLTSGPASTTYNTSASFQFSSHMAPVTFECNLDNGGWSDCTSPKNVGGLLPGSHTFGVRSVQGTHIDPVGASETWTVQPPNTKITSGPTDPTYAQDASFAFTSDDTNPLVYMCKLDAGIWHQCWSGESYANLTSGSHTFQVVAHDGDVVNDVDPVGASETWTVLPGGRRLDVFTAGDGFGSVSSSPAGIACNLGCSAWYADGTLVTVTATPDPGSSFDGWSGDCSGTGDCVVTMSQSHSVTATFTRRSSQPLTVKKVGTGNVSSSPAGIACGSACSHSYLYGTVVTLTATPASGYVFTGWTGACTGSNKTCQVSMTAPLTTTATFAGPKLLTVLKAGTGGGTVKSTPLGISCGSTCAHKFPAGTVVTLSATPKSGSTFVGWSGACSGTGSCVVTMSAAKTVKATFALHS